MFASHFSIYAIVADCLQKNGDHRRECIKITDEND